MYVIVKMKCSKFKLKICNSISYLFIPNIFAKNIDVVKWLQEEATIKSNELAMFEASRLQLSFMFYNNGVQCSIMW